MSTQNYTREQELLAKIAKALGHPARVAIVDFLQRREECYFGDLHEVLPLSKATVSQHLKELKEAGLIIGEIEPPKVKYCINRDNWKLAKSLFKELFDRCSCNNGKTTCCCQKDQKDQDDKHECCCGSE
jgi:Predicted transcriptional regulators